MPTGAILIQSTSDHSWPYPAYLCQKSVWSFIDLFFFMPDIPMTFMGEIDGHIYRCRTMSRFQTQLGKSNSKTRNPLDSKEDLVNMVTSLTEGVVLESGRFTLSLRHFKKEILREKMIVIFCSVFFDLSKKIQVSIFFPRSRASFYFSRISDIVGCHSKTHLLSHQSI